MTKDQEQAFKIVDNVCSDFHGTRKEHVTIQTALKVIHAGLNPETDKKKIKVPKKALPRDRKRKGKGKKK